MNVMFEKIIKKSCFILINNFLSINRFYEIKRKLLIFSGFSIGKGTKVVGPIHVGTCAKISIGENCWIGSDIKIHGIGVIVIGNNCDLAPEISLVTGSHNIGSPERRAGEGLSYKIEIEDGCWIGARTTIMGNTTIMKGTIIGASSLVIKDIPSNVIAAGIPAKIIKNI